MPQGDKSSYTEKQKRQAEHIEAGYEKKGVEHENRGSAGLGHRQQTHRRRQKERLRPEENQLNYAGIYHQTNQPSIKSRPELVETRSDNFSDI